MPWEAAIRRARRLPDLPLGIALTVVALAALRTLPGMIPALSGPPPPPSWLGPDPDVRLIHDGLLQIHGFADTLRWWTGTWVGQVPFYRPLTSYLFWSEWRLFGDDERLWSLPGMAAHAGAATLFALWTQRLAVERRLRLAGWTSLLAGLAFAGVFTRARLFVIADVYGPWKNQPDSFAALFSLGALASYARAREGRRFALGAAVLLYVMACGFKEIAVPLPLVALAWEAPRLRRGTWRPALLRVAALGGAGLLFLAGRQAALGGLGYVYGSNSAWVRRTALQALGPFGVGVILGRWQGIAGGLWLATLAAYALWRLRHRPQRPPGCWLLLTAGLGLPAVAIAASGDWTQALSRVGWAQAALSWATGPALGNLIGTLCALLVLAVLWRRDRPALLLGAAWMVAFLAPLTLSPGPVHRYYLSQAGYELLGGLAVGWLLNRRPADETGAGVELEGGAT